MTVMDTHAVAAMAGVTYRQLDHWCHAGYLHPTHPGRQGIPRTWPPTEVSVACYMATLIRDGYTPQAAARHARQTIEDTDTTRSTDEQHR